MAALSVPAKSLLPSVHNITSLQCNEVIQSKCMSSNQSCEKKSKISVQEIKRNDVSSPNNCSISQKKTTEVNESDDETKELVSSRNQEDKKKIRSLKFIIKLPPEEKKIDGEDEKQIANLVDEKPATRTLNSRPRRKTNFRYASEETFESEKKKKREFTNSLTREEIEEDYFYLMGKFPGRTKTNKKKRVR